MQCPSINDKYGDNFRNVCPMFLGYNLHFMMPNLIYIPIYLMSYFKSLHLTFKLFMASTNCEAYPDQLMLFVSYAYQTASKCNLV